MQALFIQLDSFLTQNQSFGVMRLFMFAVYRLCLGDAYPELTAWL